MGRGEGEGASCVKTGSPLNMPQPQLVLFWYDLCVCRLVGLEGGGGEGACCAKTGSSFNAPQSELVLFWYDLCVCRLVGVGGRSLLCEDWVITQYATARVYFGKSFVCV